MDWQNCETKPLGTDELCNNAGSNRAFGNISADRVYLHIRHVPDGNLNHCNLAGLHPHPNNVQCTLAQSNRQERCFLRFLPPPLRQHSVN